MQIKSEIKPIFTTPLVAYGLDGISDELKLDEYIETRLKPEYELSQTGWNLHKDPNLAPLIGAIKDCIEHWLFEVYQYDLKYSYEITQMWGNLQPPGAPIYQHSHHNNVIAGVFYPSEDDGFPTLSFKRTAESVLEPLYAEHNEYNQGSYDLRPQKDMLLLFPAWLQHSSKRNETNINRLSYSFNVMVRGRFDTEEHLQSTVL